jgi:hypothetical protein
MPQALNVFVDGIGFWAPGLPNWPTAATALRGAVAFDLPAVPVRPAAALLPANERRRAPDAVLIAVEVAQAAVTASGHDASTLASVFTSAHGDLAVIDALCTTLAHTPLMLSPTRFHHSVHNAASGYWAIASGSRAGSSALAGFTHSFGSGLLEALSWCVAESRPVLLVGADTAACGAMESVNASRGLLGVALVLAPAAGARSRWRIESRLTSGATTPAPGGAATAVLTANAMADALPLFAALAAAGPATVNLAVGGRCTLESKLSPLDEAGAGAGAKSAAAE